MTLANKQVGLAREEMEAKEAEKSEEKEKVKEELKNDDEVITLLFRKFGAILLLTIKESSTIKVNLLRHNMKNFKA